MTTDTVSALRQRMIEDMSARQLRAATQKSHFRACKRFTTFLKRSPDTATASPKPSLKPVLEALR